MIEPFLCQLIKVDHGFWTKVQFPDIPHKAFTDQRTMHPRTNKESLR